MSENHDLQAKTLFDKFLFDIRGRALNDHPGSEKLIQTKTTKSFPSPDASFYDENNKWMIACEFKPETETKRGILTGIGQCIGYLEEASLSYLAIPESVEGYGIAAHIEQIFRQEIHKKLPIGLIVFENGHAERYRITVPIDAKLVKTKRIPATGSERYWAKMQDMPVSICYTLLKYFYHNNSKKTANQIFKDFWEQEIQQNGALISSLEEPASYPFKYHYGTTLKIYSKIKAKLKQEVAAGRISKTDAINALQTHASTTAIGDSHYASHKKNWLTCLYHLGLVTPDGSLTQDGLEFHTKGHVYGMDSAILVDAFTRLMLINGSHLSLILDLQEFCAKNGVTSVRQYKSEVELLKEFVAHYDNLGKIKWNTARRKKDGQNEQLKYEKIFWNNFGLLRPSAVLPFSFDWKRIASLIG